MPETERRRPRAATCEDWDEDAQTTLAGSRTTANVSVRRSQHELVARSREQKPHSDGTDSGYASRADTLVSESRSSTRRKMPELKPDTAAVIERERQPYHLPQGPPVKPPSRRQSSSQSKEATVEPRQGKTKSVVHERGTCWICDQYGKHIDIKKEMSRASSVAPPAPVPTTNKHGASHGAKDDDALPDKTRRPSSGRQPRPLSMASNQTSPFQYFNPVVYGPPVSTTPGWATPVTPSVSFNPISYSYMPGSPMTGPAYAPYSQTFPFFDPVAEYEPLSARSSRRPSPVRRSSTYGNPVIRQGYPDPPPLSLERVYSHENRPSLTSRKSTRTIESDRSSMPPPPKPQPSEIVLARRPSTKRSSIYHSREPPRRGLSYEPDHYDEEGDYFPESRGGPPAATRGRRESPSRPPTSYRGPALVENRDRPTLPKKSVSYSTPTTTTKVASTKSLAAPRRSTLPAVTLEHKEAEAEEYVRKSQKTSSELTVEALRDFNHHNSSSRSETGSSYSHKSRQSSSKDSSGRGRSHTSGTKTSITLPGGLNMSIPADYMTKEGRPLSINVGGFVVSLSAETKEVDRFKEQKRIERAPSIASRASKKSVASSNISNRDREIPTQSSRRPSHAEDRVPSVKSSRQPSRAPSVNGRLLENMRRQSGEYGKEYEYAVYGA